MSKRFRDKKKNAQSAVASVLVADPIVVNTDNVGSVYAEPLVPYYGGEFPATDIGNNFPGQYEVVNTGTQVQRFATAPIGVVKDMVDYEVGGQSGLVNDWPYGTGVVSSDAVENFNLTGEQAIIRRQPDPNRVGPVGTSDHNQLLQLAYAQSVNQFYPNEQSQFDLIRSI